MRKYQKGNCRPWGGIRQRAAASAGRLRRAVVGHISRCKPRVGAVARGNRAGPPLRTRAVIGGHSLLLKTIERRADQGL